MSLVQALVNQEKQPITVGLSCLANPPKSHALIESAAKSKSAPPSTFRLATTPRLMLGLLRGEVDIAVVDSPTRARGLRVVPLFTEPLIAVFPERLSSTKKPNVQLADLVKLPMVLLSKSIDPGRAVIDQHLAFIGTRGFRVHDGGSIPEVLDQVSIHSRAGLLRQSAARFQRHGVVYKTLADPIQVGCGLAWRADNRSPRLDTFRDLLLTFARQHNPES